MSPYILADVIITLLVLGVIWLCIHMFIDVKWVVRFIKYKMEMRKKCLKTKPCQCCAYWNVRKEFCALERHLRSKHNFFD